MKMTGNVRTMKLMSLKKNLHDWGAVIIKFWVQIDKDTQLATFYGAAEQPGKTVEDYG